MQIERPIIFLGMPRSGTTVMFEAMAAHPELGWFSTHLNRFPRLPILLALARVADRRRGFRKAIHRSDQRRSWTRKLRVGPAEAYGVWERCCGEKFTYDFLRGVRATADERRCLRGIVEKALRYEGKPRFATKITGPARIGYLGSIFDDALYVHVVRDGRAVVQSLMNVYFWRDTWRMTEPAWRNGLSAEELERWQELDSSPLALAAIQWRAVLEGAREEAADVAPAGYAEIRYEDFVGDPGGVLDELTEHCGLSPSPRPREFIEGRFEIKDMNYQWAARFDPTEIAMLNELLGATLVEFGYSLEAGPRPADGSRVRTPFLTRPSSR